jgi:hypothetical protein
MVLLGMLASMAVAAEPVALVLARRTGVSAPDAAGVVLSATGAFQLPGLIEAPETALRLARLGLKDATACKGREACLAELGKQLEVRWLVLVSLSQLGVERSLGLELLQVDAEKVVEREAVLLPSDTWLVPEATEPFLNRVNARLAAAARLEEALRTGLVPVPGPRLPALDVSPGPAPHATAFALGGSGAALLVGAAALLVVGLASQAELSRGTLRDGQVHSELTASQAQAAAARATGELAGAGVAAAVGLGLGVAAVFTW